MNSVQNQDDPTSADSLCSLWCQIKSHEGQECIECPDDYQTDPEKELLCNLNEQLVITTHENPAPTTDETLLKPVDCPYELHLTSSEPLCSLWCQLEAYNNTRIGL